MLTFSRENHIKIARQGNFNSLVSTKFIVDCYFCFIFTVLGVSRESSRVRQAEEGIICNRISQIALFSFYYIIQTRIYAAFLNLMWILFEFTFRIKISTSLVISKKQMVNYLNSNWIMTLVRASSKCLPRRNQQLWNKRYCSSVFQEVMMVPWIWYLLNIGYSGLKIFERTCSLVFMTQCFDTPI